VLAHITRLKGSDPDFTGLVGIEPTQDMRSIVHDDEILRYTSRFTGERILHFTSAEDGQGEKSHSAPPVFRIGHGLRELLRVLMAPSKLAAWFESQSR
jgi:hypothetical protein